MLPMDEMLNQPIPIVKLEVLALDKPTLSVVPANKMLNQPSVVVQLEIPVLFQQDLARVLKILLVLVLSLGLIIQNIR